MRKCKTYHFSLPELRDGKYAVHLHLKVERLSNWLVLSLQNGAKERVTGRLVQHGHFHFDRFRVELWRPKRR